MRQIRFEKFKSTTTICSAVLDLVLGEFSGLIHWVYLVPIQSKLDPKVILASGSAVDLFEKVHKPPLIQVLTLDHLWHADGR